MILIHEFPYFFRFFFRLDIILEFRLKILFHRFLGGKLGREFCSVDAGALVAKVGRRLAIPALVPLLLQQITDRLHSLRGTLSHRQCLTYYQLLKIVVCFYLWPWYPTF